MAEHYVRLVELPRKVEGVVLPNDDGSFDIYINSLLDEAQRQRVLEHELRHIEQEHFYLPLSLEQQESQARGLTPELILHPPPGKLPLFPSQDSLAAFVSALLARREQGKR